jgi:hypothetical protein
MTKELKVAKEQFVSAQTTVESMRKKHDETIVEIREQHEKIVHKMKKTLHETEDLRRKEVIRVE